MEPGSYPASTESTESNVHSENSGLDEIDLDDVNGSTDNCESETSFGSSTNAIDAGTISTFQFKAGCLFCGSTKKSKKKKISRIGTVQNIINKCNNNNENEYIGKFRTRLISFSDFDAPEIYYHPKCMTKFCKFAQKPPLPKDINQRRFNQLCNYMREREDSPVD